MCLVIRLGEVDHIACGEYANESEREAIKLNNKIRRLVAQVRRSGFEPGFVAGRVLLTKDDEPWKSDRPAYHGSEFFLKGEWRHLLDLNGREVFDASQVEAVSRLLQPLTKVTLSGEVRGFANVPSLRPVGIRRAERRAGGEPRVRGGTACNISPVYRA